MVIVRTVIVDRIYRKAAILKVGDYTSYSIAIFCRSIPMPDGRRGKDALKFLEQYQ